MSDSEGGPASDGGSRDGATDGGGSSDRQARLKRIGKYLAIGVGGLVVLVVILFVLGIIGLPGAELVDNRWGEVDGQNVEVITEVGIDNPNPFGFGGEADVTYEIDLQGVRLAEGEATGIEVDSGYSTHNFTTTLFAENLPPWWSSHLNNNEVSQLEADATANVTLGPLSGSPGTTIEDEVETDIEGALDESSNEFEGEYTFAETGITAPDGTSVEPSIEIKNATTEWGEVTESETEIVTTVVIHNDNPYPIPTPAFAGGIEMNGEPLVEWTAGEVRILDGEGNELVGEEALIPPGETEERIFLAEMDNENVSVWFPTHVDSEQPASNPGVEFTEMVVTGQLAFEINGERLTVPPGDQALACEFGLRTSIFVEQDSGTDLQTCGTTPFEQPRDQLETAGALIDLEETEWWQSLLPGDGDDGILPRQSETDRTGVSQGEQQGWGGTTERGGD